MNLSSYSTFPLSGMVMKNVSAKVQEEITRGEKTVQCISPSLWAVLPDNKYIPAFSHTMDVYPERETTVDGYCPELCVDLRPWTRPTDEHPYYAPRNHEQVEFILLRARLELLMYKDDIALRSFNPLPIQTWCRMLSDGISRRCNLGLADLPRLSIIAAIYYFSLFESRSKEERWDENEWLRVVNKIASQARLPADIIMEVWDGRIIKNIAQFVEAVKEVIGKSSVDVLNVALLYGIVGSYRIGANMRETMAVALEHPPTFVAMVSMASRHRANDQMYNTVRTLSRGGVGDQMNKSLARMFDDAHLILRKDSQSSEPIYYS